MLLKFWFVQFVNFVVLSDQSLMNIGRNYSYIKITCPSAYSEKNYDCPSAKKNTMPY